MANLCSTPVEAGNERTAKAKITLGSQAGQMQGQAQVPVPSGAAPIQAPFTAMVLSGDANGIAMVSGDGQSGAVGDTLASPLIVKVTDASGNPTVLTGVLLSRNIPACVPTQIFLSKSSNRFRTVLLGSLAGAVILEK